MQLIANVWPVVDSGTSFVQRFFVRAYAIEADDALISKILRALAATDFRLARGFRIHERFTVTSEHGTLTGTMPLAVFHQHADLVIEGALRS